jgi:hypothetical protein
MHPDAFVAFVEAKYPGRWEALNARIQEAMQAHEKPNYAYWLEWYSKRNDCFTDWDKQGRAA